MYDNTIAQKIAQQYKQQPLTDFASVKPETPLDTLNLNWRERDLPEYQRTKHVHRLHPYLGKFIPQLVEIFLRKYRPTLVYDPFAGSGTTLVEANALGIDSVGTDISAFNVLLSKVKTDDYDILKLEKEICGILNRLNTYKSEFSKYEKVNKLFSTKNEYVQKWFAPNTQKELLCYSRLIKDYTYQDLLRIVLSRSARSARLVTHYDLDFPKEPQIKPYQCYKHQRTCQPVEEAYKFLSRYTIDTLDRIKEFSKIKTKAKVIVNHADSREVDLPKGIDMIFTSPPYIGLIDYHEQHKYAYELLDLKNNEIREISPAKNGQSQQAKSDYIRGINDVLLHSRDYMTKNALALIVVNDKYKLYKPEDAGFKEIGRVERHVNRRTGRREGTFYESILIWQNMITKETRNTIKGYLEGFIQGMVDEAKRNGFDPKQLRPLRNESKAGDLKPFHESLLPDGILRVSEFERSFPTKLGTTFEECARLIAKAVHKNAECGYRVRGVISAKAIKRIEAITNKIGSGGMKSKYPDLVKEVIELSNGGGGVERVSIADLYIETKSGEELFFEIKSPKPNKGQCLEATGRLLQIQVITHAKYPKTKAFYATAYNPYGVEKSTYRHSFTVNYMDLASEVLIGKEFWDMVGGKGTYEEVLSIYQEVGKEKGPDMLDQLALGY